MKAILAALAVTFTLATGSQTAHAADARQITVMLTARDDTGQPLPQLCAAGIVIGQTARRTLILTANHVVNAAERAAKPAAPQLLAEFYSARGRRFAAEVLQGQALRSENFDFALLSVSTTPDLPKFVGEDLDILGHWAPENRDAQKVRAIGNPNCEGWTMDAAPRPVTSPAAARIQFESTVMGGASGGPLLDATGALVGMVQETEGQYGVAISLDLILQLLQAANIEVQLGDLRFAGIAASRFSQAAETAPTGPQLRAGDVSVHLTDRLPERNIGFEVRLPETVAYRVRAVRVDGPVVADGSGPVPREFHMQYADLLRGDPSVTFVFADGSRFGPTPVPLRATLERLLETNALEMAETWRPLSASCCGIGPIGVSDTGWLHEFFGGFELGYRQGEADLIVQCRPCEAPEALLAGRFKPMPAPLNFPRPANVPAMWTRVVVTTGYRTPWRRITLPDAPCTLVACPDGVRIAAEAITPGAPPLFATPGGPTFRLLIPGAFSAAGFVAELNLDGRGFMPEKDWFAPDYALTALPKGDVIGVRFRHRESGRLAGPFEYRIPRRELLRQSVPRMGPEAVLQCGGNSETCRLANLGLVWTVAEVAIAFAPDTPLKRHALPDQGAKSEDLAYRQRLAACRPADCEADYLASGAIFPWPKGATDVFYRITYRDGTQSDVIRRRLQ